MKPYSSPKRNDRAPRGKQTGVVLIIALIVLVAMTLAGIGLMRAVDSNTRVAGNLGYRQANVLAGEIALRQASNWLVQTSGGNQLNNDGPGYFATRGAANIQTDANGNVLYDQFNWAAQSTQIPEDPATKTSIRYFIERDCGNVGSAGAIGNQCGLTPIRGSAAGSSKSGGAPANLLQVVQYRVTARITGPRNTVTYVQGTIF